MWNGFFETSNLTIEQKKILLTEALELCQSSCVDVLIGWKRERHKMSPIEFISLFDLSDLKLIDRVAYHGFSTGISEYELTVVAYNELGQSMFLWVYLNRDDFYDLVERYNLPKHLI